MTSVSQRKRWREAWHGKRCVCCTQRAVTGHHIIYQQHLRRENAPLWDPRNCLPLCFKCHGNHHSAHRRIPLDLLPKQAHEFADEFGFTHYLARYYGTVEAFL